MASSQAEGISRKRRHESSSGASGKDDSKSDPDTKDLKRLRRRDKERKLSGNEIALAKLLSDDRDGALHLVKGLNVTLRGRGEFPQVSPPRCIAKSEYTCFSLGKAIKLEQAANIALDQEITDKEVTNPRQASSMRMARTSLEQFCATQGITMFPCSADTLLLFAWNIFFNDNSAVWQYKDRKKFLTILDGLRKAGNGPYASIFSANPKLQAAFLDSLLECQAAQGILVAEANLLDR